MWQTVGHDWAIELLQSALQHQHLAHSWLFTGPAQIGKMHLALEMAAALNCTSGQPPCGTCPSCLRTRQLRHPDVSIVAPEEGKIKIDQIRALQREVTLSPYEGGWRVCLLDGIDLATAEAANALLKTLEEPPARVVLLLTATDASSLLPTIVSRCRVLALRLVSEDAIRAHLIEHEGQDVEAAALLARLAGGRIGWALQAAHDGALLAERTARIEQWLQLEMMGRAERIKLAESLSKRADLPQLLQAWQLWWRDIALVAAGRPALALNVDYTPRLSAAALRYGVAGATAALRAVEETLEQLQQNVNARLALEVLLLRWRSASLASQQRG